MEILHWVSEHWDDMLKIYFSLVGAASVIVKLTPTLKDDHALKEVIQFVGRYIALNR